MEYLGLYNRLAAARIIILFRLFRFACRIRIGFVAGRYACDFSYGHVHNSGVLTSLCLSLPSTSRPSMSTAKDIDNESDDYRESEDEDYDPTKAGNELSDEEDVKEVKKLDQTYGKYQGRGGLIKTRAQRRREIENPEVAISRHESPKQAAAGKPTIDIDALWGEMNSTPTPKSTNPVSPPMDQNSTTTPSRANPGSDEISETNRRIPSLQEEYIEIKRTFKFAGEIKTETKRVLKSSAEGQHFLAQQKELEVRKTQGRAPVKRKMSLREEYEMNKAKKINTLEKSRLDWLGFVDKEDIRDDLTQHNKAGYLDRQSFLNQVDQKVESDLRRQRAKSMQ